MISTSLLIAGIALAVGATVQGMVGFGISLVAIPVIAIIRPDLLPGPLLLAASVLPVLSVLRERAYVDWRGVRWAMVGRIPGTAIGIFVVDSLAPRAFFAFVGSGVLAVTLLSMVSWRPDRNRPTLATAGLVSGAFGTAMAIGGPPLALLYQREQAACIRSTLGAYFMIGGTLSTASLAWTGHMDRHDLGLAAALIPFLILGFALSGPARRLLDGGRIRYAVLGFAAASALVLILHSLF
jgi:uncharacterized membrane protein YfcA